MERLKILLVFLLFPGILIDDTLSNAGIRADNIFGVMLRIFISALFWSIIVIISILNFL